MRWEGVRDGVCNLIDCRLKDRASMKWYRDASIFSEKIFENTSTLNDPCDINRFPSGILAEYFFMTSCSDLDICCTPTCGDEDVWGADFKISNGVETRFLDVTINLSKRALLKKNKAGTFPTIFVPWSVRGLCEYGTTTYAQHYLTTGEFNSLFFIDRILSYNYSNLHNLRKNVWEDSPKSEGYMSLEGITYIQNLEGSLRILRDARHSK